MRRRSTARYDGGHGQPERGEERGRGHFRGDTGTAEPSNWFNARGRNALSTTAPRHTTRRERPRYFGAPLHWTQSKPRRTCARAARQRPLVSRVQDKIKSCPGTYWRAAEPSGSSASGNGSGTGGRSRGFGLPRGSCARPRRRRPLRQGSLPAPFPLFQYVPLQLSYLSRHLALVNLVGIQFFLLLRAPPLSQNRAAATTDRPAQIRQAEAALGGTEQHLGEQHG